MKITINAEDRFRPSKDSFMVGPTSSGYQVAYSANGIDFTNDSDAIVPANENLVYLGAMTYGYYKLVGNTDNNVVIIL